MPAPSFYSLIIIPSSSIIKLILCLWGFRISLTPLKKTFWLHSEFLAVPCVSVSSHPLSFHLSVDPHFSRIFFFFGILHASFLFNYIVVSSVNLFLCCCFAFVVKPLRPYTYLPFQVPYQLYLMARLIDSNVSSILLQSEAFSRVSVSLL